ncbi:MAG: hypothetical protein ACREA4_01260 [Nitrososphaera sp.]
MEDRQDWYYTGVHQDRVYLIPAYLPLPDNLMQQILCIRGYTAIKCTAHVDTNRMLAPDFLLKDLQTLLSTSFKDAIVWEQRDADLIGKYVYIKYDGREVGIFMGYQMDQPGSVKGAITFFFAHSASTPEEAKDVRHLFHKLLIRLNLRLRASPYKIVSGRTPAILRMTYLGKKDFSTEMSRMFFKESIDAIKSCEPLYKVASL